jgi:RNA polymerase sigma factor (TIGR02999 family)
MATLETMTMQMSLWTAFACDKMFAPRERSQMEQADEVTALLHAWGNGDRSVESRLFELVLPDLRRLAGYLMRRERPDHSLQPTALLNEVYCRLVATRERDWENRRHFFAVAGRAMRHMLIDYARARPKAVRVPLDGVEDRLPDRDRQLELAIAVNGLLEELEASTPNGGSEDWCSIVELKFFLGFTDQEAADALGLPLRTLQRRFGDVRRWLYERLESK